MPSRLESQSGWSLQITEADHEANEFRCLGGATWDTKAERDAAFDAIPESKTADRATDDFSWIVDVLDESAIREVRDWLVRCAEEIETTAEPIGAGGLVDLGLAAQAITNRFLGGAS